jgi:hypothetical protein
VLVPYLYSLKVYLTQDINLNSRARIDRKNLMQEPNQKRPLLTVRLPDAQRPTHGGNFIRVTSALN